MKTMRCDYNSKQYLPVGDLRVGGTDNFVKWTPKRSCRKKVQWVIYFELQ